MRLFRRNLDLSQAQFRLSNAADLNAVARLFRDGMRRYYNLAGADLASLLATGHAGIIYAGDEVWAVALVSQPVAHVTWLRGVALTDGLDISDTVGMLLPSLHTRLRIRGIRSIFYASDETSDAWLLPLLHLQQYVPDTEVIVYEKRDLVIPSYGNQTVTVRMARPTDLSALVALDHACFEAQWSKEDVVLRAAIQQGPVCIAAELQGRLVGYAYATSHFGNRLVHLVRIAVDPHYQGQAIGVRLLAEVIGFAQRHHATAVTLNTQAYNIPAQRLYRWFGFVTTGERQVILRCDL